MAWYMVYFLLNSVSKKIASFQDENVRRNLLVMKWSAPGVREETFSLKYHLDSFQNVKKQFCLNVNLQTINHFYLQTLKKKITPTDNYYNVHLFLLSPLPAATVTLLHASLLTKNTDQLLPLDTAYLCLPISIPPSPQKWNSHSCLNLPFFVSTTSQDPDLFQICRKEQNL